MAEFKKAFDLLIKHEGGFSNHLNDSGGVTNFGITHRTLARWRRKRKVTVEEMKSLKIEEAIQIYRKNYWNKLYLENLHCQLIADLIFDQAVNFGTVVSSKRAQRAANRSRLQEPPLIIDGIIGPKTIRILNRVFWKNFSLDFIMLTQDHYIKIVTRNQSQIVFLRGWIKRTHSLFDRLFEEL